MGNSSKLIIAPFGPWTRIWRQRLKIATMANTHLSHKHKSNHTWRNALCWAFWCVHSHSNNKLSGVRTDSPRTQTRGKAIMPCATSDIHFFLCMHPIAHAIESHWKWSFFFKHAFNRTCWRKPLKKIVTFQTCIDLCMYEKAADNDCYFSNTTYEVHFLNSQF